MTTSHANSTFRDLRNNNAMEMMSVTDRLNKLEIKVDLHHMSFKKSEEIHPLVRSLADQFSARYAAQNEAIETY